ncbi:MULTISPECIES: PTS glucitol/sorbitol transporter subunit IIA [Enterococcus]|uniref:PTS sorbitol transporter subunit IIA n=2 Tax=root TaxID=1 RepID=A0A179ETF4_ENTTH|nr:MULTISPECIES: PTS glucitol/sorbitol transporter subunit IIA [Enterococcus]ASZ08330.1 PTS sorbitol transporter subunit IIA [Enterococcus thailandicus]MDA3965109.1 PTS glucitol/sorbitol transporter subunit IIA [Enterococcus thailandicus]MDK4352645.1 PTS glucitol/sorbitol transporter subunit IIA [Enterococcus thailandicus]MDT2734901.1 PTS glucitol/sorbitol transporter subunit IIA [Enterococcus thailandicus]MDT2751884.1 PTS glucitol/sorbitol transporter subunit IIA [Enterococcus thailandicus]
MIQANVVEIGPEAINEKEPMLILFNNTATTTLRNYSIIQEFLNKEPFKLESGKTIRFDEQEYTIEHVGTTANQNLETVGHVTLVFDEHQPENTIVNGVYLNPYQLPEIHLGTQIYYQ